MESSQKSKVYGLIGVIFLLLSVLAIYSKIWEDADTGAENGTQRPDVVTAESPSGSEEDSPGQKRRTRKEPNVDLLLERLTKLLSKNDGDDYHERREKEELLREYFNSLNREELWGLAEQMIDTEEHFDVFTLLAEQLGDQFGEDGLPLMEKLLKDTADFESTINARIKEAAAMEFLKAWALADGKSAWKRTEAQDFDEGFRFWVENTHRGEAVRYFVFRSLAQQDAEFAMSEIRRLGKFKSDGILLQTWIVAHPEKIDWQAQIAEWRQEGISIDPAKQSETPEVDRGLLTKAVLSRWMRDSPEEALNWAREGWTEGGPGEQDERAYNEYLWPFLERLSTEETDSFLTAYQSEKENLSTSRRGTLLTSAIEKNIQNEPLLSNELLDQVIQLDDESLRQHIVLQAGSHMIRKRTNANENIAFLNERWDELRLGESFRPIFEKMLEVRVK